MKGFIALICLLVIACSPTEQYHTVQGETMGTYYRVTYKGTRPDIIQEDLDALLEDFNNSLSTYISSSLISRLNESENGVPLPKTDPYFTPVLAKAKELKYETDGKLNTTIMPLLKYWRDSQSAIDSSVVEDLLRLVKFSNFDITERDGQTLIVKSDKRAQLDFSALAKGYGIDVVAASFQDKGISDYLVDIGGEARAQGVNSIGQSWTLAINTPIEGAGLQDAELILQLDGKSIATSGTYRQFYEKDGKKIAHIMSPLTGLSTTSNILSASVLADDCMTADGVATALMVGSLEEGKEFLKIHKYPACLIYDEDGIEPLEKFFANGFEKIVVQAN